VRGRRVAALLGSRRDWFPGIAEVDGLTFERRALVDRPTGCSATVCAVGRAAGRRLPGEAAPRSSRRGPRVGWSIRSVLVDDPGASGGVVDGRLL
jgi:hypothetical protein